VALLVLYFVFVILAVIAFIFIQLITGGRAGNRSLEEHLNIGFVGFVGGLLVSMKQGLWTVFLRVVSNVSSGMGRGRVARTRRPASTVDPPKAAGIYRFMHFLKAIVLFYFYLFFYFLNKAGFFVLQRMFHSTSLLGGKHFTHMYILMLKPLQVVHASRCVESVLCRGLLIGLFLMIKAQN